MFALRRIARKLRYRELKDLLKRELTLCDVSSVSQAVQSQLALPVSEDSLQDSSEAMRSTLAKYGHLDLTFKLEATGADWGPQPQDLTTLRHLGFATLKEFDPTMLEILGEDLDEDAVLLRLFLEERPARDFMTFWTGTLPDGRIRASLLSSGASSESMEPMLHRYLTKGYFPKTFIVVDACITNARSVWIARHFYL